MALRVDHRACPGARVTGSGTLLTRMIEGQQATVLQLPASAERNGYIAALLFNHAWASRQAGDPRWIQELQSACNLSAEFCQAR